jgi:molybdenum cofactor synthesis domain-containing protein
MTAPSACFLIIGNEILSGRTQDKNLNYLARGLNDIGVRLMEARVIPDVPEAIVEAVNACRARFDYVFTSGGIGPTHDDITTACIARAFGVPVVRHAEAERRLLAHYRPEQVNAARMRMADVPEGARLIDNAVSVAPGFYLENVFVMAGVPSILQAMFDTLKPLLKGGAPMVSRTVSAYVTEGTIAAELGAIQARFAEVEIGSYPFMRDGKLGTSLVARGVNAAMVEACAAELAALLAKDGAALIERE